MRKPLGVTPGRLFSLAKGRDGMGQWRRGRQIEAATPTCFPSSVARQLRATPMMILARRIEHVSDVTIQCSHHANAGEHRWAIMFRNQQ
jgi:hypothetical protein